MNKETLDYILESKNWTRSTLSSMGNANESSAGKKIKERKKKKVENVFQFPLSPGSFEASWNCRLHARHLSEISLRPLLLRLFYSFNTYICSYCFEKLRQFKLVYLHILRKYLYFFYQLFKRSLYFLFFKNSFIDISIYFINSIFVTWITIQFPLDYKIEKLQKSTL